MNRPFSVIGLFTLGLAVWNVNVAAESDTSFGRSGLGPAILNGDALRSYVNDFNSKDHTHGGQAISNEDAADWMADNIPLFECPDSDIEEAWTTLAELRKIGAVRSVNHHIHIVRPDPLRELLVLGSA